MTTTKLNRTALQEDMKLQRAHGAFVHSRPTRWLDADKTIPDPESYEVVWRGESHNLITNAGRDFMHQQCYGTTASAAALAFIGLSNDTLTETIASTVLSSEITTLGLGRAVGTVSHTAATNITTVSKTFTASGAVSMQKAALFTAITGGTMNHVLAFAPRSIASGDTFSVTFTITMG